VKRKEDPPRRRSPVSPPASLPSSSNGTLLELDLARTGLACDLGAALPPLVEAAPRLRALDASGNAVTGTPAALAAALACATSLQALDISQTALAGPLADACGLAAGGALRSLTALAAGLTGALPACLAAAPGLQALHLDWNELDGPLPELAPTLARFTAARTPPGGGAAPARGGFSGPLPALPPSLALLDLTGHSLEGPLPDTLPAGLAEVRLAGNAVSGALPPAWAARALTVVDLSLNPLSGGLPPSWANSSSIVRLALRGAGLGGDLPADWLGAASLAAADLAANAFTGALPPALARLPALRALDVSDNQLSEGLVQFADAVPTGGSRLAFFDASRNALAGAPLAAAAGLARLAIFAPAAPQTASDAPPARALALGGNAGLRGPFPAWLVDALTRLGEPAPAGPTVALADIKLTCPSGGFASPVARPTATVALARAECAAADGHPTPVATLLHAAPGGGGAYSVARPVAAALGGAALVAAAACALATARRRGACAARPPPPRAFARFGDAASPTAGACAALRVGAPGSDDKPTPRGGQGVGV